VCDNKTVLKRKYK